MRKTAIHLLLAATVLSAHPMGNFSVNHYARLYFKSGGMELIYVLDLAEIPTFQLMGDWKIDWKDQASLSQRSKQQGQDWLDHVSVTQSGRRVLLRIRSVSATAVEGAGGMPVLRTAIIAQAMLQPGEVVYEDENFAGRAGWKEIVVDHDPSAIIRSSSQSSADLSKSLTYYPTDPSITPPQDLTARVDWSNLDRSNVTVSAVPKPVILPPTAPAEAATPAPFSQQQPEAPGTVVRGDFLSRMLQQKKLPGGVILLGILVAFGLGAMHAMSPGHGKTIVAAYLVGSRGTLKHAGLLGLVVTFTHTFTVFLLGLGMLFFQRYFVPEKIVPILGAVSGLSIVSVGLMLFYKRAMSLMASGHSHAHFHGDHFHAHDDGRPARSRIAELRGTEPRVPEDAFEHTHGGTTHSHVIEAEITPGSLIALGISGGMVPCPSALILMLSAIALGHPGVGLVLLAGFSAGLALVLMAFGMLAIYAKHLLPNREGSMQSPVFRLIPVFSAVVVIVLGLAMTAVSAGWIRPLRFLS
jgi:nickel/cobalt transporter (NicO) family protein